MGIITGAGYWRITTDADGTVNAELLDDENGGRLMAEGDRIVRVEENGAGLLGYQNSGAILQVPGGQAVPAGAQFSLAQNHE